MPRALMRQEEERVITWKTRLAARIMHAFVRLLCATVRLQMVGEAETERRIREEGGVIFVTWHGRTLMAFNRFQGRGFYGLVSLSRDGDFLTEVFRHFGFRTVRGSTGRRGVQATREILDALKNGGTLAFTPDGPRGPTHKVQPGVVYFAQRSGRPIVPAGLAACPRKLASAWDSYMIPAPFSRAVWIYGEPIYVAPDENLEEAAIRVERAINALEEEAERRAGVKK